MATAHMKTSTSGQGNLTYLKVEVKMSLGNLADQMPCTWTSTHRHETLPISLSIWGSRMQDHNIYFIAQLVMDVFSVAADFHVIPYSLLYYAPTPQAHQVCKHQLNLFADSSSIAQTIKKPMEVRLAQNTAGFLYL